jgi:hypothetical protein
MNLSVAGLAAAGTNKGRAMTTNQTIKLEAIKNRATRYEVVLTNGTDVRLVGYTARKGRPGLMSLIRAHGPAILAVTNLSQSAIFKFTTTREASLGENGWIVKFTGRTQRDAILAGEVESI